MSKTKKVFGVLLTLLALTAVLAGFKLSTIVRGTHVSTGDWWNIVRNPRGEFPADKSRINILLLGKDYSYLWTKGDPALNGARHSKESRSDTIMLLSLDLENRRVSALSIPRDTRVTAPDGVTGKINATYRRGGVKLVAATVSQLLGVTPDYFIEVNPDAVKRLVDELGGVEVETLDVMKYDDRTAGLHIDLPKGRQIINGEQAVGFARFREADIFERNPDGTPIYTGRKDRAGNPIFRLRANVRHSEEEGDGRRTARQQQLIRAMATRAKEPQNWLKADQLINIALDEVRTNLTRPQLFAVAALFRNMPPDQIQTATLEGRGTTRGTYFIDLDRRKTQAMVDWLIKGDESAANRLTTVAVKNATNVRGAARGAAALLQREGFNAAPARGSAPAELGQTQILYGTAAVAGRAGRIAALLGGGAVSKAFSAQQKAELGQADVSVVLGRDLAPTFAASRQEARLP